ncbi:hypothetical protein BDZ85DRAFT_281820 [Elsinoe ampelina]|uniref:Uncharacterized protein n=1 Tax=Elsinoe ampelina TaxID=302913 RepID=A0A6A6GAZ6_9PEZI|nr:hypothetical protein BDZ85DRAFT_281820 [Elsinoe ampelina]
MSVHSYYTRSKASDQSSIHGLDNGVSSPSSVAGIEIVRSSGTLAVASRCSPTTPDDVLVFHEIDPNVIHVRGLQSIRYAGPSHLLTTLEHAITSGSLIHRSIAPLSVPISRQATRVLEHDLRCIIQSVLVVVAAVALECKKTVPPIIHLANSVAAELQRMCNNSDQPLDAIFRDEISLLQTLQVLVKITSEQMALSNISPLRIGILTRVPDELIYHVQSDIAAVEGSVVTVWLYCEKDQGHNISAVLPIAPRHITEHLNAFGATESGEIQYHAQKSIQGSEDSDLSYHSAVSRLKRSRDMDDARTEEGAFERRRLEWQESGDLVTRCVDLSQELTAEEILQNHPDKLLGNNLLRVALFYSDTNIQRHREAKFYSAAEPHQKKRPCVARDVSRAIQSLAKEVGMEEVWADPETKTTLLLLAEFNMARRIGGVKDANTVLSDEYLAQRQIHKDTLKQAMQSLWTWPPKGPVAAATRSHTRDMVQCHENQMFDYRVDAYKSAKKDMIEEFRKGPSLDRAVMEQAETNISALNVMRGTRAIVNSQFDEGLESPAPTSHQLDHVSVSQLDSPRSQPATVYDQSPQLQHSLINMPVNAPPFSPMQPSPIHPPQLQQPESQGTQTHQPLLPSKAEVREIRASLRGVKSAFGHSNDDPSRPRRLRKIYTSHSMILPPPAPRSVHSEPTRAAEALADGPPSPSDTEKMLNAYIPSPDDNSERAMWMRQFY